MNSFIWLLRVCLVLVFFVLLARLVELQIIKGDYFRALAEENRLRRIPIIAPRGQILARGGEILVGNKKVDQDHEDVIFEWERDYLLGEGFSHVSGYLGNVNSEELNKIDPVCPEKGAQTSISLVGRAGLEQQYSCPLRGLDGEELVEIDTHGAKIRTLGTREPTPGVDLNTTIDYGLQSEVAKIFQNKEIKEDQSEGPRLGAVIASDTRGEILAMYSSAAYEPKSLDMQKNLARADLPLFNRAIGGAYHPGSVFKMVTSIGALETGKITSEFSYDDPGVITINEYSYANWLFTKYNRREGKVNLERALARSTDTYYYKVGEMLGAESLADWARKFGYGTKTGIDIPGEVDGLVPDPDWKMEAKKERWFLGNTYHMAIGQGDLAVTPLQVNSAIVALANDGKLCQPHILMGDSKCSSIGINPDNLESVKKGMLAACQPGGTASPFFDFDAKVACKTGTAETVETDVTHAWFVAWGPLENPEVEPIIITVLVEKGGEGSAVAAPIARDILDYWQHAQNP